MTGSTDSYVEYVLELLQPIQSVKSGKFFGGIGLKSNSTQFAMIMDNSLFFVVDNTTRPEYEKYAMDCFCYKKKTGPVNVKKYYRVPEELFEDQDTLIAWARESIYIAKHLKK